MAGLVMWPAGGCRAVPCVSWSQASDWSAQPIPASDWLQERCQGNSWSAECSSSLPSIDLSSRLVASSACPAPCTARPGTRRGTQGPVGRHTASRTQSSEFRAQGVRIVAYFLLHSELRLRSVESGTECSIETGMDRSRVTKKRSCQKLYYSPFYVQCLLIKLSNVLAFATWILSLSLMIRQSWPSSLCILQDLFFGSVLIISSIITGQQAGLESKLRLRRVLSQQYCTKQRPVNKIKARTIHEQLNLQKKYYCRMHFLIIMQ